MSYQDAMTVPGRTEAPHGPAQQIRAEASRALPNQTEWGVATTAGHGHNSNDDAFGQQEGTLFVLCDGMGGAPGGRLAAATAVQHLLSGITSAGASDWTAIFSRVSQQVQTATRARGFHHAGTTMLAASVTTHVVTIAHVGDSRVYRVRDDEVTRLSSDHTVQAELAATDIDPREYAHLPAKALTRFIGAEGVRCHPEIVQLVPQVGDVLLLLTRGAYRQLEEADFIRLAYGSAAHIAAGLIAHVEQTRGPDNATALVIGFSSDPTKGAEPSLSSALPRRKERT